jgi:ABC-type transporter MlaC component
LVVEGLSFIANYRTDFGREIQATGIDTFISNLQQKTSTSQYAGSCEISATC